MNNIIINKEGNFKNETISSIPIGNNNIILETNEDNMDLKKNDINNNIKPMLTSNSNTISIPDGKKVKIRPLFKKVPSNTFSMMANTKKNINVTESSDSSNNSESDDILSNNTKSSDGSVPNNYNEEHEDPDDYSSIESNVIQNQDNNEVDDEDDDEGEEEDDNVSGSDNASSISKESVKKKQKTYEEIQQEKQQLLFNLERLQKQGYPQSKKYIMA